MALDNMRKNRKYIKLIITIKMRIFIHIICGIMTILYLQTLGRLKNTKHEI